MKAFVIVISGLLLSSAASAQTNEGDMSGSTAAIASGATEASDDATANADESQAQAAERRICRRVEMGTGSRTSARRMCMTAAQWRNFNRGN